MKPRMKRPLLYCALWQATLFLVASECWSGDLVVDGDLTVTGRVTATEGFFGDGSGLTNLPAVDDDNYAKLDGDNEFAGKQTIQGGVDVHAQSLFTHPVLLFPAGNLSMGDYNLYSPFEWANMVIWAPLNEGAGNIANDYSPGNNAGVITNATWVNADEWRALTGFGRITFSSISQPTNKYMTVAVWAYPESGGGFDQAIAGTSEGWFQGWRFIRFDDTRLQFRLSNNGSGHISPATGTLPTNRWVHLVARISNTTSALFVDGVRIASNTNNINSYINDANNQIRIGGGINGIGLWNGMIADVKVTYDNNVPDSVIEHLYDFERSRYQ